MIVLEFGMVLDSLMIAGHVVRAWGNDQTVSRPHRLTRLVSQQIPTRQRIVKKPVEPPGNQQRRSFERPANIKGSGTGKHVRVVSNLVAENRGQGFYARDSNVICARCLFDQLGALRR